MKEGRFDYKSGLHCYTKTKASGANVIGLFYKIDTSPKHAA
jgi:hypothetical protein